jgi:hypothetical protein
MARNRRNLERGLDMVTIHESGNGGEKLQIVSYGNGAAYAANFGESGAPMRTLFFQGDDADLIRQNVELWEEMRPDMPTRNVWLEVLNPYLD